MQEGYKRSPLFRGMMEEEIDQCIKDSGAQIISYRKEDMIFRQNDKPRELLILVEGSVAIGNDTPSGKRSIMGLFTEPGELFGEVFLFLDHEEYDNYAQAMGPTKVLEIPKGYMFPTVGLGGPAHSKMLSNMMTIFARKSYYLNRRLQILSCSTLRQKIAKFLLQNVGTYDRVVLNMSREELADFLNTARPSLSRELMKMQEEGLIKAVRRDIIIKDLQALKEIL